MSTEKTNIAILQAAATIHAGRLQQDPRGRGVTDLLIRSLKDAMELQRMIIYGLPVDKPDPLRGKDEATDMALDREVTAEDLYKSFVASGKSDGCGGLACGHQPCICDWDEKPDRQIGKAPELGMGFQGAGSLGETKGPFVPQDRRGFEPK